MKEIPVCSDVAAIESSVKNKWRWAWLTEDEDGNIFGTWCKKTNQPGACLCMVCQEFNVGDKRKMCLCAPTSTSSSKTTPSSTSSSKTSRTPTTTVTLPAKRPAEDSDHDGCTVKRRKTEQNDIRLFFF